MNWDDKTKRDNHLFLQKLRVLSLPRVQSILPSTPDDSSILYTLYNNSVSFFNVMPYDVFNIDSFFLVYLPLHHSTDSASDSLYRPVRRNQSNDSCTVYGYLATTSSWRFYQRDIYKEQQGTVNLSLLTFNFHDSFLPMLLNALSTIIGTSPTYP